MVKFEGVFSRLVKFKLKVYFLGKFLLGQVQTLYGGYNLHGPDHSQRALCGFGGW